MSKAKASQSTETTVQRVLTESPLTIPQAQKEIQAATGVKPDRATFHRWILRGKSGIRLEAVRLGRAWITSSEALNRFIVSTTEASLER
jgi:hypothetical protein